MTKKFSIQSIVFVAVFAALTFIATNIKVPLPTGAFVHMGNAVLLLSVLLLGYVRGSLAGGIGFALFDIFNGYVTEAPYFIVESFIVGAAAYAMFLFYDKKPRSVLQVTSIGIVAGISKLVMTQIKNTVMQWMMGSSFTIAFHAALLKLPASIINVVITIVVVAFLYFPLKLAFSRLSTNK